MSFRYLDNGKLLDFITFLVLATLGCLSKISAASLLAVLVIPMLDKNLLLKRRVMIAVAGAISLAAIYVWYYQWVPHLNSIGLDGYFFMGLPFTEGLAHMAEEPWKFLKKFIDAPVKYVGFALVIGAVVYAIRSKDIVVLCTFLVPFLTFIVFVVKSGKPFYINGYYFVMIVPVMAFMAGIGLTKLRNKYIQIVLLSAIAVENVASQYHVFRPGPPYYSYAQLENIFDSIGSSRTDLIAIGDADGFPMAMYMSHRKGWTFANAYFRDAQNLEKLRSMNCKYVLVLRKIYGEDVDLPYPIAFSSEDFVIYKL